MPPCDQWRKRRCKVCKALPVSVQPSAAIHGESGTGIEIESQLELCGVGHSARMPGRAENDLGVHFSYFGELRELEVNIAAEHISHAAAARRTGHLDFAFAAAAHGWTTQ